MIYFFTKNKKRIDNGLSLLSYNGELCKVLAILYWHVWSTSGAGEIADVTPESHGAEIIWILSDGISFFTGKQSSTTQVAVSMVFNGNRTKVALV